MNKQVKKDIAITALLLVLLLSLGFVGKGDLEDRKNVEVFYNDK